jgi:predicted ATPase
MIDREEDLEKLSLRLNADRFVTIVGSGGVGKTTVAVAIAHPFHATFNGAVLFVDLSMVSDPRFVTTGVASMLGLSVRATTSRRGRSPISRERSGFCRSMSMRTSI